MLIYKIYVFCSGLLFSMILGHYVVRVLVRKLREYVNIKELNSPKLTATLGMIERLVYSLLVVGGKDLYVYIGIFFGLKLAQRLVNFSNIENDEKLRNVGERINIYFICNVLSLIFGILGGVIIRYFLKYNPCS